MKTIIRYSLVIVAIGVIYSCGAKSEDAQKVLKETKALDQKFVEAYNKLDADGVMSTYWNSPELVSFPPGEMEEKGWENVKKGLEGFFNSVKGIDLTLTDMNYKIMGEVVISWGKWRMTIMDKKGGSMDMTGRYTDIKAKKNGKWVYILDHASVPLPPPPGS